jgi:oxidase EvaA
MQDGVARTASDLEQVLRKSRVGFEVTKVPASATDQWGVVDGALQHASRGFFSVIGVSHANGQSLLMYQPQAAVTGLLTARIDGELCALLQARAEPGCLGEAQFGPTVQSTPANFMRLHGGAPTPYIDAFIGYDSDVSIVDDTSQLDLGERYFFKTKRSILAHANVSTPPRRAFVWATRAALCEALGKSAFFNIDLRSILSIATWSREESGLAPKSTDVRRNLEAPMREDVLGKLLARPHTMPRKRFVPLTALENWRRTEWGWSEREPRQGFEIAFYDVKAAHREKAAWVQPLVNSASDGRVVLACRERDGFLEFLVRAAPETGLATAFALHPSHVRYPGVAQSDPDWLAAARPWSATMESDEGGRFFRDTSSYEIVRVDDADMSSADGQWLRLSELKAMLRVSNLCSIQLRGVASQLLGA